MASCLLIAALERIEAGGAAVEQATAKIRAFVQEADELRITLRLNYSELNDALKREKQSRTAWQTFVDRLARIIQEGSDFGRKTKASAWYECC